MRYPMAIFKLHYLPNHSFSQEENHFKTHCSTFTVSHRLAFVVLQWPLSTSVRPLCFASFLAVPNKWRLYMQSVWLSRDRAPYKQTQMTFSSTPPLFSHCFLIGFLNGVWPTATPCFHTERSVCLNIFITSGCGGSSSVWRFCCLMQMF